MGRGRVPKLENALAIRDGENPGWLEIAIDAAPELNDPLSAFFFDLGATGLVFEDFGSRTLKAYLPLEKSPEDIQNRISVYLSQLSFIHPHLPSPEFRLSKIENQDWQRNWRRFFSTGPGHRSAFDPAGLGKAAASRRRSAYYPY